MPADLAFDLAPGARLEPGFEQGRRRTPVWFRKADDDLVLVHPADAFDAGPSTAGIRRPNPQTMEIASVADPCPIPEPAAGGQFGSVALVSLEVPAQPPLAIDEECAHLSFGIRPAATTRRRNGHHDATIRMDDDA